MKWLKQGQCPLPKLDPNWAFSHAMVPTPWLINDSVLRIYLTFCDQNHIGRVGYVDYDANDLNKILAYSEKPVFDIGIPGTFDENGVLQCSIVPITDKKLFMYYVGFELGQKIRYRLLTGLAISEDGGLTFKRHQATPILDRSPNELFFRGGPFVLHETTRNIFKMWYASGSSWMDIGGKSMPVYTINYLESTDGINWPGEGQVVIPIEREDEHGFGRPYIIKEQNLYKMFYSIRKKGLGYRLGYAESKDGIKWQRKDDEIGLDISSEGWDSEMVCYSALVDIKDTRIMFYNGNNLGETGFGYASLSR